MACPSSRLGRQLRRAQAYRAHVSDLRAEWCLRDACVVREVLLRPRASRSVSPAAQPLQEGDMELGEEADVRPLRTPVKPTSHGRSARSVSPPLLIMVHLLRTRQRAKERSSRRGQIGRADPHDLGRLWFSGTTDSPASELPILVVRGRWSKSVWSHPAPSKGVGHPHGATSLLRDLQEMGYKRLVLKSDQEPSTRAVCTEVKAKFAG